MPIALRCPNGHSWKTEPAAPRRFCPTCGAEGTGKAGSFSSSTTTENLSLPGSQPKRPTTPDRFDGTLELPASVLQSPAGNDATLPPPPSNTPFANDQTLPSLSAAPIPPVAANDQTLASLPGSPPPAPDATLPGASDLPASNPSQDQTLMGLPSQAPSWNVGSQQLPATHTETLMPGSLPPPSVTTPTQATDLVSLAEQTKDKTNPIDATLSPPAGPSTFDPDKTNINSKLQVNRISEISPPPAPAATPGSSPLQGYEIIGVLGRGGMGIVYKAKQLRLNRVVALKMILAGGQASRGDLVRFHEEAQAVAKMQHPNILQIYEVGEREGRPFFSLEFLEGGTLQKKLQDHPLKPREAAELIEKVARALEYAHRKGILHRDIKPANILLTSDGTPKISDFGLAKTLDRNESLQPERSIVGTPAYMPPEQALGKADVGPAADIYALGATLYEMLVGRPPFEGSTVLDTLQLVRDAEPVPFRQLQPTVPGDLQTICLKCLEKDAGKRYTTAEALADDLRNYLEGKPIQARPVSNLERGWKWSKRHPAAAGLIVVSILSLIGLAVGGVILAAAERRRAENEAANADKERGLRQEADEQRLRAQVQEKLAKERGDEALRNFQKAQEAVEVLVRLASSRLTHEKHLETIGRELMEKALEFYDDFLGAKPNDPTMRKQVARANWLAGNLHEKLANYQKAEKAYRNAEQIYTDLVREVPAQANVYRRELAGVFINQATVYQVLQKSGEADEAFRKGLELLDGASTLGQRDPVSEAILGAGLNNQGNYFHNQGQTKEAADAYQQAIRVLDRLTTDFPRDPCPMLDLARTKVNLALLWTLPPPGQPEQAEDLYRQAIDHLTHLVKKFPSVGDYRKTLGLAYLDRGILHDKNPKLGDAGALYQQAQTLFDLLASEYPGVADYRHSAGVTQITQGDWLRRQEKWPAAAAAFERARLLLERLVEEEPKIESFRKDLGSALSGLTNALEAVLSQQIKQKSLTPGDAVHLAQIHEIERLRQQSLKLWTQLNREFPSNVLYATELSDAYDHLVQFHKVQAGLLLKTRPIEAENHLEKRVQLRREVLDRQPSNPQFKQALAEALLVKGTIQAERKQHAGAAAAMDEIVKLVTPDWPRYYVAAACLGKCTLIADTELNGSERESAVKTYGERTLKMLDAAIAAGWHDAAFLRAQPGLQTLRTHADFRDAFDQLVRRAEKKAP